MTNNSTAIWNQAFESVQDFAAEHHRLPNRTSPSGEEKYLARWCANQRLMFRKATLSGERQMLLSGIRGWLWSIDGAGRSVEPTEDATVIDFFPNAAEQPVDLTPPVRNLRQSGNEVVDFFAKS
jgi:hypothetical protein